MDNSSVIQDDENFDPHSRSITSINDSTNYIENFKKKLVAVSQEDGGKKWPQVVAATGANMGAFAFGTVLCWSATAVPSMKNDDDFDKISETDSSWISSIVTLGALVACLPVGYLLDRLGRRRTMLLVSFPLAAGWLLLYFAQNVPMILCGRFITGMCSGAYSMASPIFIAEISQPKIRGMLLSGFDLMTSLGVLFQLIVGTYISWRWQSIACLSIPVILFGILFFVPESPRYLLSKQMQTEAFQSISWLRGVTKDSQLVLNEIKELNDSIEKARQTEQGGRFRELFKSSIRKSMFIGFMLFALQIFSGMTATTFYRVEIFQSSGSGLDEYTSSIIVASMFAASLVDRVGRKLLLMVSNMIMTLSLGALGAYFHIKKTDPEMAIENLGWLPLGSLVIFVFGYSVGMGAIPYSIVPEILPQRVRGLGSSILTSSRWTMAFLVTRFFKDIVNTLGEDGCYWLFAASCLFGIFFVFFVVPETKGKSLEVIQQDLNI